MKALYDLHLTEQLQDALRAARDRITAEFAVNSIVLFGSVARGTADQESDVDLLIVLSEQPDHKVRNRISSLLLDINLEYDTNLTCLVVDRQSWEHGLFSVLPIHTAIEREGIAL
jgi:predicted nucleotidyltransferase